MPVCMCVSLCSVFQGLFAIRECAPETERKSIEFNTVQGQSQERWSSIQIRGLGVFTIFPSSSESEEEALFKASLLLNKNEARNEVDAGRDRATGGRAGT